MEISAFHFPAAQKCTWTTSWGHCLMETNLTTNRFVNLRPDFKHPDVAVLAFLSNQPKREHWDSPPVLPTHCLPACAGAAVRCAARRQGWWSTGLMCSKWCTSSGWWCSHCEHRGNLEQSWPPSQSLEHPLAMRGARECKRGWALIRRCVHAELDN